MSSAVGVLAAGGAAEALLAAAFGVVEQALDGGDDDLLAGLADHPLAGWLAGVRGQSVTHCLQRRFGSG